MSTHRDQIDNTTRAILHNSRGIELAERGWLDEAIKEFRHAIESTPDFAQGYDNLGTAYADKGDLFNALTCYTKALSLDPHNPIALHNLGCFLSNYGNQLAIKCFKDAIKLEPELYEARFNLGLSFAAEEKHEKAIAQFEKALCENDQDQDARFHLALSLMALERYAHAIKELLKIVKADKDHEQAFYYLGLSYQEQGFLDEAVNAFTKAIMKNGKNVDAHLSLASVLARLSRNKEAKAAVRRAISLDPKRSEDFIKVDEYLCHDIRIFFDRTKPSVK